MSCMVVVVAVAHFAAVDIDVDIVHVDWQRAVFVNSKFT